MGTFIGIDYSTWWFLVVGALFSGYAILDGFDLGAGAWHLFFKKEESRRIALNAIGPVWDGNEVWLVIGGGALFAGFPIVYANMFSAMYIPFMLFLAALIFRAVAIEFRSKEPMQLWRTMWDVSYSISSITLALLLGVVLGNILIGIPLDEEMKFRGSWLSFLNPYALMVGVTTVAAFMMHGAIYLGMKTQGKLFTQIYAFLKKSIIFFVISFIMVTIYTLIYIPHLTDRFKANQWMFIIPAIAFLAIANIPRLATKKKFLQAFLFSALSLAMLLMIVAIELYPVIIFNTANEAYHITVQNSASSSKSLRIMLTMAAIGVPLIATYTNFVYKTFWGKVELDEHSY